MTPTHIPRRAEHKKMVTVLNSRRFRYANSVLIALIHHFVGGIRKHTAAVFHAVFD